MTTTNVEQEQELIRHAAIHLFSHKGFYKTSTEEIEQEAGVSKGTVYNYFHNKKEILLSILRTPSPADDELKARGALGKGHLEKEYRPA